MRSKTGILAGVARLLAAPCKACLGAGKVRNKRSPSRLAWTKRCDGYGPGRCGGRGACHEGGGRDGWPSDGRSTQYQGEVRAAVRAMWALGDYNRFATELDSQLGRDLVEACENGAGQHVLDVAAGSGNVAIRAAEAGAEVVASDITVENMKAGEREASERGVELEWVEGDAQALPFGDAEFDVVTSSAGADVAPDQQAVADELLRVCRPDGTIGMANFTPDGLAADFFGVLAPYLPPPPPDAPSPLLWGDEVHRTGAIRGPGVLAQGERTGVGRDGARPAGRVRGVL